MTFRPGQRLVIPGVQVFQPRVTNAVASTWWDNNGAISGCVAAYAAKGAASLAASYTNLANPGTYTAAPGVAPTFNAADGWTFNGSTQYLTTGVIPAAGWSALIRFSDNTSPDDDTVFGSYSGATLRFSVNINAVTGNNRIIYQNGGILVESPGIAAGVVGFAGQTGYRNAVAASGTIGAWSGTSTRQIYIGATNLEGSISNLFPGKIQAFAIYNVTLTAGQVATITTAMQAL